MKTTHIPTAAALERLPWPLRALLGCATACLAVSITYAIGPLRVFPVVLAIPAVILCFWFLGTWGGLFCTLTEALLINFLFSSIRAQYPLGSAFEGVRLTLFLAISLLLGWTIRRLAQQNTQIRTKELQQSLLLAQAERQRTEEHARISQVLRERDEMLNIALEVNGMGLWVWNLLENEAYGSDEICRLTGREPGSLNRLPRAWLQLVHPEDAPGVKAALAETRDTGNDYHQQYRLLWPDGTIRWMESQGKCQRNSDGRVTRVVGVLADITHRKLTEEAMLRTEKLAVAGRMAASVAHEINNPLEAITNLLFLLRNFCQLEDPALNYVAMAEHEAQRISEITQQTLRFYRQSTLPTRAKISELLDSVLSLYQSRLGNLNIEVVRDYDPEIDLFCFAGELRQVFANLVGNAIDATTGSGRLRVRARRSSSWHNPAQAGVRFTLADTGAGMAPVVRERIFEAFFTTKEVTGTGLGLWVSHEIIVKHHGLVHVRSRIASQGKASGTVFQIFIPDDPHLAATSKQAPVAAL